MWIVSCDDDKRFTGRLRQTIADVTTRDDHITIYNCGMALLDAVKQARRPIDVLLLDMEMPGLNGLDTARELRLMAKSTTIIVVTSYSKYALPCYDIRALHYLLKPLNPERLKPLIDEARRLSVSRSEALHIGTKKEDIFVPICDVQYIYSIERSLHICTGGNIHRTSGSISYMEEELRGRGFYRIHKSYIVNLSNVYRVDKASNTVYLSDGTSLPVGNRKQPGLISALLNHRAGSNVV